MKTITMPLEEYQYEIKQLQEKVESRSYTKGAIEMANLIKDRLVYSIKSDFLNNAEASRKLESLIVDLMKDYNFRIV